MLTERYQGRIVAVACLLLAALGVRPPAARGEESYYLLVFAAQRNPNWVRYTHTFGTFVKATGRGADPCGYRLESFTISWLPCSLEVHPWRLLSEPGIALDLPHTLAWAERNGARVSLWGPYRIQRELYERGRVQLACLQAGRYEYKALDGFRRARAVDCIHALSDVDSDPGYLRTLKAHGDEASYLVLLHFRRWLIDPCRTADGLVERLGLGTFPLVRRTWDGPRVLIYR